MTEAKQYKYDVALSFAGEQREYVEEVANILRQKGINCFYDNYKKAELWGKDLSEYFMDIYYKDSQYCIMFISQAYANKEWAIQERKIAIARAIKERGKEYILPVRFDDTEIPGLLPMIDYVDATKELPKEIADLFELKLRGNIRQETKILISTDKLVRDFKASVSDGKLESLLTMAIEIAKQKNDKKLAYWAERELLGWKEEDRDSLPDYRIIKTYVSFTRNHPFYEKLPYALIWPHSIFSINNHLKDVEQSGATKGFIMVDTAGNPEELKAMLTKLLGNVDKFPVVVEKGQFQNILDGIRKKLIEFSISL